MCTCVYVCVLVYMSKRIQCLPNHQCGLVCISPPCVVLSPHTHTSSLSPPPPSDLLSGGRTSLLYTNLVQQGKALSAQAVSAYPADRHPNVFFTYGVPTRDGPLGVLAREVKEQAQRIGDGKGLDERALERLKKV